MAAPYSGSRSRIQRGYRTKDFGADGRFEISPGRVGCGRRYSKSGRSLITALPNGGRRGDHRALCSRCRVPSLRQFVNGIVHPYTRFQTPRSRSPNGVDQQPRAGC